MIDLNQSYHVGHVALKAMRRALPQGVKFEGQQVRQLRDADVRFIQHARLWIGGELSERAHINKHQIHRRQAPLDRIIHVECPLNLVRHITQARHHLVPSPPVGLTNKQIEIVGQPGITVGNHRISPNDEKRQIRGSRAFGDGRENFHGPTKPGDRTGAKHNSPGGSGAPNE